MEGERIEAAPSDMFSEKQKGGAGVVSDSDFLVVGEEETEEESGNADGFVPGPLISLKQELEKDKVLELYFNLQDDESLRRWKENLLGCTECNLNGQSQTEPEVTFHSLGVITENCLERRISVSSQVLIQRSAQYRFWLGLFKHGMEEGLSSLLEMANIDGRKNNLKSSIFRLLGRFLGMNYLTCSYGLRTLYSIRMRKTRHISKTRLLVTAQFSNDVFFSVMEVDRSKGMVGTFAPQREPYTHVLEEETTPSGLLARGVYLAKLKVRHLCHLKLDYSFEIKRH
ncbi:hypothetical protein ACLOJK_011308 [Asimina triloba]